MDQHTRANPPPQVNRRPDRHRSPTHHRLLNARQEAGTRHLCGTNLRHKERGQPCDSELDTIHAFAMVEDILKLRSTTRERLAEALEMVKHQLQIHRAVVLTYQEAVGLTGFKEPAHLEDMRKLAADGHRLLVALAQREARLALAGGRREIDETNTTEDHPVPEGGDPRRENTGTQDVAPPGLPANTPDWISEANRTTMGVRRALFTWRDAETPTTSGGDGRNDDHQERRAWNAYGEGLGEPDDGMLRAYRDQPASFYEALPPPWNIVPDRPVRAQEAHKMSRAIEEFDGTPLQYAVWRAGFISMVHRCATEIDQKIRILFKTFHPSTRMDPRVAGLRRMPPSPDTYHTILRTLETEFGGDRRLLASTMRAIQALAPIRITDATTLRNFTMHVTAYVQHCRMSEQPADADNLTLFNALTACFHPGAIKKYKQHVIQHELEYDVRSILAWLDKEIREFRDADLFHEVTAQAPAAGPRPRATWRAYPALADMPD